MSAGVVRCYYGSCCAVSFTHHHRTRRKSFSLTLLSHFGHARDTAAVVVVVVVVSESEAMGGQGKSRTVLHLRGACTT